ncbi:MAG: hypothetical protein ABIH53_03040, partial [archaeon]
MDPYKYNDINLCRYIKEKENLQILEEILAQELEYYNTTLKKKLKFGKRIPKKHLEETLEEIKTPINEFLDITPGQIDACKITYPGIFDRNYFYRFKETKKYIPLKLSLKMTALLAICTTGSILINLNHLGTITPAMMAISVGAIASPLVTRELMAQWGIHYQEHAGCYWPDRKEILITRSRREALIPVLAHEYTHHITERILNLFTQNAFNEGIAMGTESHIAKLYHEKEDNKAFEYNTTLVDITTLTRSYAWSRQQSGKEPNKKLVKSKKIIKDLDHYDVGNAYFKIEAAKKGETAYKDALHELSEAT